MTMLRKKKERFHSITLVKSSYSIKLINGEEVPIVIDWRDSNNDKVKDYFSKEIISIGKRMYPKTSIVYITKINDEVRDVLMREYLLTENVFTGKFSFSGCINDAELNEYLSEGEIEYPFTWC